MRSVGLLLLAAGLSMTGFGRAETQFPYSVAVPAGGVILRSGPGQTFYATDRVAAGASLEVYREEHGGWLAVRPPTGSFSLVERHQLKAGDEAGVAVVVQEDVLSCVGSRVQAVSSYVSQVRLRKDEPVELLAPWNDDAAAGEADVQAGAWCRIAPPAGEFRWLQASDLKPNRAPQPRSGDRVEPARESPPAETAGQAAAPKTSFEADGWRTKPADLAGSPPRSTPPATVAAEPVADSAAADGQRQTPTPATSAVAPRSDTDPGWTASPAVARPAADRQAAPVEMPVQAKHASQEPAASPVRVPVDGERLLGRPVSAPLAGAASTATAVKPAPPVPTAAAGVGGANVDASESPPRVPAPATSAPPVSAPAADRWTSRTPPPRQSIEELEVDLAMMVAQDAQAWRLAELRQRVDANLLRFETAEERVQARRLLDRISEFEQLQSRLAQVSAPTAQPVTTPASAPATAVPALAAAPAPLTASSPDGAADGASPDVKYDGSGWLVPVHSATGAAPPFALLDAQGEVLGYVSPTPGLNLQRYLRKQVGIFGLRGFVPTLNKPHVTAERVVDLDRHLR